MRKGDPVPMLRRITATALAIAIAITTLACGGGDDPPQPVSQAPQGQATVTQAPAETQPQDPMPTRPQRLDLSPTTEPAEEKTQPTPEATTGDTQGRNPEATQPAEAAGTPSTAVQTPEARPELPAGTGSPLELIPQDPETSDEVLLQDIYALMDLDRFALNPNEPIPLPEEGVKRFLETHLSAQPGTGYPHSHFDYDEIRLHPYLHLFPTLRAHMRALEQLEIEKPDYTIVRNRDIPYNPYREPSRAIDRTDWRSPGKSFRPRDGITRFIHHPWFEPAHLIALQYHNPRGSNHDRSLNYPASQPALPHWFGKNSTRGVLAEAVEEALQQARRPDAQQSSLPVEVEPNIQAWKGRHHNDRGYTADMGLGAYLRSTITTHSGGSRAGEVDRNREAHQVPFVQWEFVHPRLPIVRVTTHVVTLLPLSGPDGKPATATFSTSFVISFQNRWTSFDDPGRWLAKFPDRLTGSPSQGNADPEFHQQHFPNYWHPSDYMQHRLIGPVVVTVHENLEKPGLNRRRCQEIIAIIEYQKAQGITPVPPDRFNPDRDRRNERIRPSTLDRCERILKDEDWEGAQPSPLIPGTYAVEPRVSHWEAPGPVLTDQQFEAYATGTVPRPNWPLPGDVLTTPGTGPGTEPWEKFEMDRYDW